MGNRSGVRPYLQVKTDSEGKPVSARVAYKGGAFGTKGFREVEYDYVNNHGRRSQRTGLVERRKTILSY